MEHQVLWSHKELFGKGSCMLLVGEQNVRWTVGLVMTFARATLWDPPEEDVLLTAVAVIA